MQGRYQRLVRKITGNPQCRLATFSAGTSRALFAKRGQESLVQPFLNQFGRLRVALFCIRARPGCTRVRGQRSDLRHRIQLVRLSMRSHCRNVLLAMPWHDEASLLRHPLNVPQTWTRCQCLRPTRTSCVLPFSQRWHQGKHGLWLRTLQQKSVQS